MSDGTAEEPEFIDAGEAARRMVERSTFGVERYPTGFEEFDLQFGCIGRGELCIVSARSSVGKSTFLLNSVARTPVVPTVVFSLEMEPELQSFHLACMSHELMLSAKNGLEAFADEESAGRTELLEAMTSLGELYPRLAFEWPPSLTVKEMRRYCGLCVAKWRTQPRRVYVDHLGLMPGGENREAYVVNLRSLKEWAVRDQIAVIVVQQVNRKGDGEKEANHGHIPPGLASGMLGGEEQADMGFGLSQPGLDPKFRRPGGESGPEWEIAKNVTRVNVWKNRIHSHKGTADDLIFDYHSHRLTPRGERPFVLARSTRSTTTTEGNECNTENKSSPSSLPSASEQSPLYGQPF